MADTLREQLRAAEAEFSVAAFDVHSRALDVAFHPDNRLYREMLADALRTYNTTRISYERIARSYNTLYQAAHLGAVR